MRATSSSPINHLAALVAPSLGLALALAAGAGCGADIGGDGAGLSPDAGPAAPQVDASTPPDAAPAVPCVAEGDLMIVLDRSGSMSQRPDGTMPPNTADGARQTKWYAAVTTIKAVAAQLDDTIHFGLELFPLDPNGAGGTDCSNLSTWLTQYLPPETNDAACNPAEVLVQPALHSASAIDGAIDVDNTGLCGWTPTGAGISAASDSLSQVADPSRPQAVLLITDGADTCDDHAGYTSQSLPAADALAAAGMTLYVVGFDGSGQGIDPAELNDLACAGKSAPDFKNNCAMTASGYRAVASPSPARLFFLANDQAALTSAIRQVAGDVCGGDGPVD